MSGTWIVVLNWNGRDDTLELLDTLAGEPATVLVVDNGSFDGTLEAVRERHPEVHTLQTGANLGYAGGNNVGITQALAADADIVAVLNNDTLVEPGFLTPLVEIAADGAAAVSPDIRYADEPEVSWFRGSRIDLRDGWPQHLPPADQPPAAAGPFASPVLTGCCVVASAQTWRRVGLFDDGMFLMFEDSDWSRRAADAGVDLIVAPRSRIRHKVSRSFTGEASVLGTYYFARNGAVFAARHLGVRGTARFVVRRVLRSTLGELRDPARRPFALMAYLGLLAALTRRRGPAGRVATALARRVVAGSAVAGH
ncbi:glycosyltransferase family 2 protein [uncultured Jatrophihabitans sp.]|uniref:glycosyltransferase family 2 protein n=1 Tax=uncultured Jatrophihabitans sp. TaxID=1610747 RepID=UPI0035CA3085